MQDDSTLSEEGGGRGKWLAAVKTVSAYWPVFLFSFSAFVVLLGWSVFGVSPLQPLEEIAYRQREYRQRRDRDDLLERMVARHVRLGTMFLNVGRLTEARSEFEQALSRNPSAAEAHMGLLKAEIYESVREHSYGPDIIRSRIQMILQENPRDPQALLFLGQLYSGYVSGRPINWDTAVTYYRQALAADSTVADAYEGLGWIYYQREQDDSAVPAFRKAQVLSPWNVSYIDNLAYYDYRAGRVEDALRQYATLVRLDPDYLSAYYTLANSYRMAGKPDSAVLTFFELDLRLQDSTAMAQDRNAGCLDWRLKVQSLETARARTCSVAEKRAYALYGAAATWYLMNRKLMADSIIRTANALLLFRSARAEIRNMVAYDLLLLYHVKPEYGPKARAFIERYF